VLVCRVWGVTVESSERSVIIQQPHLVQVRLPTTYLPSDGTTALLLDPPPSLRLINDNGASVDGVTCSLASASYGAEVRTIGSNGAVQAITTSGGWLNYTAAVVVSSFSVPSAALAVACSRVTPDAPDSVAWTAMLTRLTLDACEPLAPVTDAFNGVPPWHIGIAVDGVSPCGVLPHTAILPPAASQYIACAVTPLMTTYDAGGVTAGGAFQLFVISGTVHGTAVDGSTTFDALQLIGSRGMHYNVSMACTLGAVAIPATHDYSVQVLRCPAGHAPSGMFCTPCATGTYTRGENEKACLPCPAQGAECVNGLLTLKPNFYRELDEAGTPVSPTSQLLPCYNAEACIVNVATEVYTCAPGYTGTLCGVCAAGYTKFSSKCRPCWSTAQGGAALAGIVTAAVAFLTFVSLRAGDSGSVASWRPPLKMLLGFVQAVSALRAFKVGGTPLFQSAMSWSDGASTSPLAAGGVACLLQLSMLGQLVAIVLLPAAGAVGCILIVAVVRGVRQVQCNGYRLSCNLAAWRRAMASWMDHRRHIAAFVFLLFLFYMPIVSACCRALSCTSHRIDGALWLLDDLSVQCFVGQHAAAVVMAVVVLVLFGAGFPAAIMWTLVRAPSHRLHDKQFVAAFGFLYLGYQRGDRGARRGALKQSSDRQLDAAEAAAEVMAAYRRRVQWWAVPCHVRWTAARYCCARLAAGPQTRVWWEAVVLLRKAVLVVLAMVVTDPFLQVMLAVLLFATTTVLQQHMLPYTINAFNNLETGMLAVLYITAAVSTLQLPTTVGATVSPLSATITDRLSIVVLVLNLAMTAALGGAVAWYAGGTVTAAVKRRAAAKLQVVTRRLSVVARPSVVHIPAPAKLADPVAASEPEAGDPTISTVDSERTVDSEPTRQHPEATDSMCVPVVNADPSLCVLPGAVSALPEVASAAGSTATPFRRRQVLQVPVATAPASSTTGTGSTDDAGAEFSIVEADSGAGAVDVMSPSHRVLFKGAPSVMPSAVIGSRDTCARSTAPPLRVAPGGAGGAAARPPRPPRLPPPRVAVVASTRHRNSGTLHLVPQPTRRPPRAGPGTGVVPVPAPVPVPVSPPHGDGPAGFMRTL